MIITKIKLSKFIYFFLCIIISICLTNCKPPNPFIKLQTSSVNKNIKDIVEPKNVENIKVKKEKVINESNEFTKLNDYKNKERVISLKTFLNKDFISVTNILGKPNLIIKHTKIQNYQYHFSSCYLDLFFKKKNKKFVTEHFEIRASKLNNKLNKKICINEITKFIKK